ncbi:MAG: NAD(P)H-dependent glycerol-3-phosphate dehydrogenase [Chloroflexota bacterium]
MKVAVIGTTAWGTALGIMLARGSTDVALWARTEEEAERLESDRENVARLSGVAFPDTLSATASMADALTDASLVILAVPSQQMRHNVRLVKEHLSQPVPILSVAKGLEKETTKRMSQVIAEELGPPFHDRICTISGPNFSREIARGLPAATVLASPNGAATQTVHKVLSGPSFRVEMSGDMVGVELAGALKNVIALGAGMLDALGYGDNAKAAFVSRGYQEITRLAIAAGADPDTFAGLAGIGDLVATCSSPLSRNRTFGAELAKGRSPEDIQSSMTSVVEGIATAAAALKLAHALGVQVPITEQLHRVLFEGFDLVTAMEQLALGGGV